jgi:hypothetical protein
MQVSKQQQRIRGIVERAHTLLVGALDQMYDVFDGEAHTITYIEAATAQVRDTLSHFDKDAIAYNRQRAADETAKAIEDAAAKKKEEDAAAAELAEGGSASFDDKGKRVEGDDAIGTPIERDKLSDFGEGSDQ